MPRRHRIVFSTVDDFRTMHPALAFDPADPLPAIAAVDLGVARIGDTADFLVRQAIGFTVLPDGTLALPAAAATGAILFFGERRRITR
jgi:hypothetical protein